MPDFARHYAASSDEALLRWADDVENLVPEARGALMEEMDRRRLVTDGVQWDAPAPSRDPRAPGWIFIYCFGALVIDPIWTLLTVGKEPRLAFIFVPYCVLLATSAVMLLRRSPRALRVVRWCFIYYLSVVVLGLLAVFLTGGILQFFDFALKALFGSILLILWWFYFRRSKMVRAVYGKNMDGLWAKAAPKPEAAAQE